jgi:hypothetical protein
MGVISHFEAVFSCFEEIIQLLVQHTIEFFLEKPNLKVLSEDLFHYLRGNPSLGLFLL